MFPNVCLSLQKENMKTTVMNDIQTIQSKIYEIRGQRVMLDRDLAELYQVTTDDLPLRFIRSTIDTVDCLKTVMQYVNDYLNNNQ